MLWLALYCPTLALDCIVRRWPAGLDPAIAVVDTDGSRRFVAAATATAQGSGVAVGQSVATAIALEPELVVVERDPEGEQRALTDAAFAALRFTPTVSLRASGLLLEVSGSLRLFGGGRRLKKRIAIAMRSQGLGMIAAEAPTPHGAWLLARSRALRHFEATRDALRRLPNRGLRPTPHDDPPVPATLREALGDVPVGLLESADESWRAMVGIGLRKLADLWRLPVASIAQRFGPTVIDELGRAIGDVPDPQPVFSAPIRFEARLELMARVETADALIFAGRRLVEQMAGWLRARRAAVRGFTLLLHHDRWRHDAVAPTAVPIALASPSSDPRRLVTLIRERFERLELVAPVLELSVAAPTVVEEVEMPAALFAERDKAVDTVGLVLEKFVARLGPEAMGRIERNGDYRPERGWRDVCGDLLDERMVEEAREASRNRGRRGPRGSTTASASRWTSVSAVAIGGRPASGQDCRKATPSTLNPRPVWLLREPQPLAVRADRPIYEDLPLFMVLGPERLEANWWSEETEAAERDYFVAENITGLLVWVYKERFLKFDGRGWYLQGLFG